jgi:hypothetical protein
MDGYLNTRGKSRKDTLRMIIDAGFTIKSDKTAAELLVHETTDTGKDHYSISGLKSAAVSGGQRRLFYSLTPVKLKGKVLTFKDIKKVCNSSASYTARSYK